MEKRPDAVGFISLSLIKAENRPLHPLPLNGVAPTLEALEAGRYPLPKIFYMVTKTALTEGTRAFIEFIQSPTGRDILRRTGHVPND